MQRISFSGHESFTCKQFWLKKIFDYASPDRKFGEDTAVVDLGVGKNMVSSLRYWGKAFGILNEDDTRTRLANYLFADNGKDPYLEDLGTIWLLHYQLIKTNKASLYHLFFNDFRKERSDFTKDQFHAFLKRKCEELYPNAYNLNTITTDISVFLRNYLKPHKDDKIEIEDDFNGILIDLDLIKEYKVKLEDKITNWYRTEGQQRFDLPYQILLFAILTTFNGQTSITFRDLLIGVNSPGSVFALNADGLYQKLMEITSWYPNIIYSETAGNQILQLKDEFDPYQILNDYYNF